MDNTNRFYHVSVTLGENIGLSNKENHGLPLFAELTAPSQEVAEQLAHEYAEKMAHNIFHDESVCNQLCINCEVKFRLPYSLSVLEVEVHPITFISSWGDYIHSDDVRNMINYIWSFEKYQSRIKEILGVYFERDKENMANRYCDGGDCIWDELAEHDYAYACKKIGWKEVAYEWFNYEADDGDIRCVIDFLRPYDLYPNSEWQKVGLE